MINISKKIPNCKKCKVPLVKLSDDRDLNPLPLYLFPKVIFDLIIKIIKQRTFKVLEPEKIIYRCPKCYNQYEEIVKDN